MLKNRRIIKRFNNIKQMFQKEIIEIMVGDLMFEKMIVQKILVLMKDMFFGIEEV